MSVKKVAMAIILVWMSLSNPKVLGQRMVDKNGMVAFEASEALFEPVAAKNETVTAVFDLGSHEIASLALMKGFRFENSLMEEHFNENYVESETYPKATFKGKLQDFELMELTTEPKEVRVDGKLKLHGKEKDIDTYLNVSKTNKGVIIRGSFVVTPGDFDISIPSIVKNKIAKEVRVSLEFNLVEL